MTNLRKICYILRHAKAQPAEAGQLDNERALAPRGVRNARQIGRYLKERGYAPSLVLCSTAYRTRETLANVMPFLPEDVVMRIEEQLYMASRAALLRRLREIDDGTVSVMIVGHNPGLEDLVQFLVGRGPPSELRKLKTKFPTAALARIDLGPMSWSKVGKGSGVLTDLVYPREMETTDALP